MSADAGTPQRGYPGSKALGVTAEADSEPARRQPSECGRVHSSGVGLGDEEVWRDGPNHPGEIGGGTVLAVSAESSDSGPHLSPAFRAC